MTQRSRWIHPRLLASLLGFPCSIGLASTTAAQVGTVKSELKISATTGGFGGVLESGDAFGVSIAPLGDLDGDGNPDLAVAASGDHEGGAQFPTGAVWILFLDAQGAVRAQQQINAAVGGFGGTLDVGGFAQSVACLGDLDGDGHPDLAVGEWRDDDGGNEQGAVWILFLQPDGTVRSEQKISETAGNFAGSLDAEDHFGLCVGALGDLDGDGIPDLAVGTPEDDDGGENQGAVWVLFLNSDGTVREERKISALAGGFGGGLDPGDAFGTSVAFLGGAAARELAVGAAGDDFDSGSAGEDHGAVWILFLNADGTVSARRKINERVGGFGGDLDRKDFFGGSVGSPGDIDGDGVRDLAVGAAWDDDGGADRGAVWILFLNADGTVRSEQKISATAGGFGGILERFDFFGSSAASLGDLDGDGIADLAAGMPGGDETRGAVWILFLEGPPCFTLDFETEDDFVTQLANGQALSTPPEFGELVRISSAGANAGPATFDSTPGGPNDPALNDDMLIGQGNLLLLEDDWYAFAQTVPGLYDVITDDPDGGDLIFDFTSPVEPRSLSLADINPPPNQGASVTLFDAADRTRVYAVEPGWTGGYGDAGPHLLDLATLAPQPGNGTPRFATASEDAGFDAAGVVRLVVHLTGPGAIDDLSFCIPDPELASVTERNGSGLNPTILRSDSRPALGETWNATLDCSGLENGVAVLELRGLATSGTLTPYGEVLVEGALLHRASRVYTGSPSRLVWRVPYDMSLLGLEVHVQGFCRGQSALSRKSRAARIVLSNALDLVLGF